jgi:hypothetical protein
MISLPRMSFSANTANYSTLREGSIRRHDVLGGLIHDYYREAA